MIFGPPAADDKSAACRALLDIIPETAAELRIGNPYYQIVFEKRNHEGIYGQAYSFTLADAVEDCTEWIVHWEPFVEYVRLK